MFEAILWDNDGVLVDTEGLYFQATSEALAGIGVELTADLYRQLFLVDARGAWHLAEARLGAGEALAALKRSRDERYHELIEQHHDLLLPDVTDAVARLGRSHRMAIVTSSEPDHFARIHRRTALLPHFELVLTRRDYGACKPHPEPYLTALARLGLSADRALVVEDSERGLRAAKAAGLTCWVVPSALTRPLPFAGADRVLGSLAELVRLLEAA
jgi:HAD superfamily hydrolase (TIGR01509 family)